MYEKDCLRLTVEHEIGPVTDSEYAQGMEILDQDLTANKGDMNYMAQVISIAIKIIRRL